MKTDLTKNETIQLEVALIKKEINEFQYNEHDVDYQFNQVVDWGVKLKQLSEKLLWVREANTFKKDFDVIARRADELNSKWDNIGKNSFFAFQDGEDEVEEERKEYPNRKIRYRFTDEQIRAIRKSSKTNKEIARVIGCSASLICQIKNRGIYKKV